MEKLRKLIASLSAILEKEESTEEEKTLLDSINAELDRIEAEYALLKKASRENML